LTGEIEVLGENLPQCDFVHHKPCMLCPEANPDRRGGKPATNRLSYGTASAHILSIIETVFKKIIYFELYSSFVFLLHLDVAAIR
jgi:hypothetical protein